MNANEFLTLRNVMDRVFQDSYDRTMRNGNGAKDDALVPRADAWEDDEQVGIEMALPGVTPEQVDITFEQDTITIQGTLQAEAEGKNWILRERPRGTFRRRFTLQVPIDPERVEASYRDGVLYLTLPKSEAVKPRKITVKSAS